MQSNNQDRNILNRRAFGKVSASATCGCCRSERKSGCSKLHG